MLALLDVSEQNRAVVSCFTLVCFEFCGVHQAHVGYGNCLVERWFCFNSETFINHNNRFGISCVSLMMLELFDVHNSNRGWATVVLLQF